jgi:hypothetical protein
MLTFVVLYWMTGRKRAHLEPIPTVSSRRCLAQCTVREAGNVGRAPVSGVDVLTYRALSGGMDEAARFHHPSRWRNADLGARTQPTTKPAGEFVLKFQKPV